MMKYLMVFFSTEQSQRAGVSKKSYDACYHHKKTFGIPCEILINAAHGGGADAKTYERLKASCAKEFQSYLYIFQPCRREGALIFCYNRANVPVPMTYSFSLYDSIIVQSNVRTLLCT